MDSFDKQPNNEEDGPNNEEDGSNNKEDGSAAPMDSNRKKRKGRGPTTLPEIIKNRSAGIRLVVEYDEKGRPVGENQPKFVSYLGVLARTMVPIDHKDWFKVPAGLKGILWNCVESSFDVDPRSRKKVLSSISVKWRTFKQTLSNYICKCKSDPNLLSKPPKKYYSIEQKHWDSFVKSRICNDFEVKSKVQRKSRSKNKLNHRISRKGYAKYEAELKKRALELGTCINSKTTRFDRSVMWKKARQNKKGEYDDEEIVKQVAKIDEITKQVDDGSLSIQGSNDILTIALGTREHSGRVRGVGGFVTPSAYFHVPRRGIHSSCEETLSQMRLEIDALKQSIPNTPHSDFAGSNNFKGGDDMGSPQLHPSQKVPVPLEPVLVEKVMTKDDMTAPNPQPKEKKSKPCKLAVGSHEQHIVAHGTVYERVGQQETIHTVLLGKANVRVSIDLVIVGDALLPIPIPGEATTVEEAMGYQLAWPKNLVSVDEEGAPKKLGVIGKNAVTKDDTAPFGPITEEKVTTKDNMTPPDPQPQAKKSKPCKLAVGSHVQHLVAHGTMYERVGPQETIHTVLLGDANVRVSIDLVIVEDALLPIPIPGEAASVGEAKGYQVAWPKNLVLVDKKDAPKNLGMTGKKVASKHRGVDGDEATSKNVQWERNLASIRSFGSLISKHLKSNDAIGIPFENEVFGAEVVFHLQKVDMGYICELKEVSVTCIAVYMRYLYDGMKASNNRGSFLFVNPYILSAKSKAGDEVNATLLAQRLEDAKPGELVVAPCNIGFHWSLLVIEVSTSSLYYLDSVSDEIPLPLKLLVRTAFIIYESSKGNRIKSLVWKVVQCPKQPRNVECGFYVMMFMRDLIRDQSILSKNKFNGRNTYTKVEMDEVRAEWINFVMTKYEHYLF